MFPGNENKKLGLGLPIQSLKLTLHVFIENNIVVNINILKKIKRLYIAHKPIPN